LVPICRPRRDGRLSGPWAQESIPHACRSDASNHFPSCGTDTLSPPKSLVIRNSTCNDIVLKMLVVDSRRFVIVGVAVNTTELANCAKRSPPKIYVYARPVTAYNERSLRQWLTGNHNHTNSQLAFIITVIFSNSNCPTRNLILDLPGHASLVDPLTNAIDAKVDEDCTTAINIEDDTDTFFHRNIFSFTWALVAQWLEAPLRHARGIDSCAHGPQSLPCLRGRQIGIRLVWEDSSTGSIHRQANASHFECMAHPSGIDQRREL
uniref:Tr-type G domain-containing protein n=1 Tax=Angiostrongylus cantonensis TaxID=6313 RepID=A0A0K0DGX1_ANGCA